MPLSLSLGLGLSSRNTGGGAPAGFSLWTTNGQPWVFSTQRAISPARPQ